MTWFTALIVVMLIVAVAAVTGIKARGTRHVAGTRLMGVARIALIVIAAILAYAYYQTRAGG